MTRLVSSGPPFGQCHMPERTSLRSWRNGACRENIDRVIHHADAALEAWFGELGVDLSFDPPESDAGRSRSATMSLVLSGIREQVAKRNTESRDLRDDDGRVVGRQRAIRFFELDYTCSVAGPHPTAHEVLGQVLQLLVDNDTIPVSHLPSELTDIGEPVEVSVIAPTAATLTRAAALTVRVIVPVQPTAEREIAPPAVELHLEMLPAPGRTAPSEPASTGTTEEPMPERQWTTVRRRERITPGGDPGDG